MTLHWWMHWFWVTLCFTVITGIPLPTTKEGGELLQGYPITATTTRTGTFKLLQNNDTKETVVKETDDSFSVSITSPIPIPVPDASPSSSSLSKQNLRVSKAIGQNPPSSVIAGVLPVDKNDDVDVEMRDDNATMIKNDYRVDRDAKRDRISVLKFDNDSVLSDNSKFSNDNKTSILGFNNRSLSLIKKDSKVTWILNSGNNKTSRNEKFSNAAGNTYRRNSSFDVSNDDDNDDVDDNRPLAVLPLQEPIPTRFKLVLNKTNVIPSTNVNNNDDDDDDKLLNKSQDVEIREDIVETRILATAASILQGISESPRLSRARSAFQGDYQQDEQQVQKQTKQSQNSYANATSSAVDIAAVTGSCLATLLLIGTMGSLGFVMYRRRYMNPPQTLNSDKCSNPDSSGYIDDSTIRDNSEEMYSLDNDSFLNSLEAMTIQNYWTDSVKHTKL